MFAQLQRRSPKTSTIMKKFKFFCCLAALASTLNACDFDLNRPDAEVLGTIRIHFDRASIPATTKSAVEIPDTNDFILKILKADGTSLYDGKFGAAPEAILAAPGSYSISVTSCEFNEPVFDCPQFGDQQVVMVNSGEDVCVIMNCAQTNAGVRLIIDPSFRTAYPQATIYLTSADGKLMYGYGEKRTAYFKPGTVNLTLAGQTAEQTLLSRTLEAQQMLNLKLSSADYATEAKGLFLQVDTSRIWIDDSYIDGGSNPGESPSTALSVSEAKMHIGQRAVWVYGYIVGDSTSSVKSEFTAPFSSNTNILLASKSSVSDRNSCIAVELSKGDIRDLLNLKDNPSMLGKQVYLRGNIESSYYGLTGLKSVTAYQEK